MRSVLTGGINLVIVLVMTIDDQLSLAEAKAHLSEVVEGVETEHRRVIITKHGRPSVVVLAIDDLEALEETLDILSDPDSTADLREADRARRRGESVKLTKEEALARWSRG
jgi:antitoxin YefM